MTVKHSIRKKIGGIFIGLMLLALTVIMLCNYLFLDEFYITRKTEILIQGMEQLNVLDLDDTNTGYMQFCMTNNLTFAVTNTDNSKIYSNMRDGERLASRLFGYVTGIDVSNPVILEETDQYRIQTNQEFNSDMMYVEIWGMLDDGRAFIIRSPLESIQESVKISNSFFLTIGIIVVVAAAGIIWWMTRKITQPIIELTEISQKMAELDFDTRYESGGMDEIGVLGRNFNTMSKTLESTISELKSANLELQQDIEHKNQIDEMRKEFLSNVSHELKTPLALIQGYAEGLLDNVNDDEESRQFYCDVIIDEAAKMNTMVKKLLTLNQLEFGNDQITMERFDITVLIRGILQSVSLLAQQKDVDMIFYQDTPVYVWGDEFKIEEVVTNYLSNALNHVKDDRKIEVRCKRVGDKVRISVFNTGDPIPEEDIDKIWIKFYKVDKARTREYGGSGIGLSIVKAIMDSMHQACGVQNYENGVEFWFELEAKV